MKSFPFLCLVALVTVFLPTQTNLTAQQTISGEQIIVMLNEGKDINLKNTRITGNLDFSKLTDQEVEQKEKSTYAPNYRCHVRNQLSFDNCTFEGKVLAFLSVEDEVNRNYKENTLFNTDFHAAVVFKDCTFAEDAFFKYSHFYESATFTGSNFTEEALFKYTKFSEIANFTDCEFGDTADFKYTKFKENANFTSARFTDFANFKYTEFPNESRLTNAVFERKADFKYAEFSRDTDLTGVEFQRDADFKYTKKGGRAYRP